MGLIQRVEVDDLREHISTDETVPCPMCGKRHRVGLVGDSGMTEECFASLLSQRRHLQAQVNYLATHGRAS